MKGFKKIVKHGFIRELDEAGKFALEQKIPEIKPSWTLSENLMRCAAVAMVCGMLGIMALSWEGHRYSPARQALDGKVIQEAIPKLKDLILSKREVIL